MQVRNAVLMLQLALLIAVEVSYAAPTPIPSAPASSERILVKRKATSDLSTLHQSLRVRIHKHFPAMGNLEIIEIPAGTSANTILEAYRRSGLVEYAEPDRVVHALSQPNDTLFQNGELWHLNNTGQSGGTPGADIHAVAAWDTQTSANNVIVAVLDTGIWTTHEDLAPNLWHNPGEIAGNGIDDDGDGYIDDVSGINVITGSGNPTDDHGHGSHVAGLIGAAGNNSRGVVGVCWQVQIMACKFLNSNATGLVSDAITAINYARTKGAKIINLSWGDPAYGSQALRDAIASARDAGIIVVCACGNSDNNNDVNPLYPASFDLDNIVAVAATTRNDVLAGFSSYGATTVDLGAPGESIVSCWTGVDNNYALDSGTSMAAPMVAGACALAWARYPTDTYRQIIDRILTNVDPLPSLAGKCVTGGRLNLQKVLAATASPNNPPFAQTIRVMSRTNIVISWPSEAGRSYQLQSRSNFTTDVWQNVGGAINAVGTNTSCTNSLPSGSRRFFVIRRLN